MWSSRIHLGSGGGQASDNRPPITLSCKVESGPALLTKFNPVWGREGRKEGKERRGNPKGRDSAWHGMVSEFQKLNRG